MEFNFDPKQASIFQLLKWERYSLFKYANVLRRAFFSLFVFLFLLFLFGFFTDAFSIEIASKIFGLSLIFLSLGTTFWLLNSFFQIKIKNPPTELSLSEIIEKPFEFNLAEFLSFELAKAVSKTIKFARSKKLSQIPSTPLFYFLLRDNPKLNFVFSRANVSLKILKSELKKYLKSLRGEKFEEIYSLEFQDTILESLKIAKERGHSRIEIEDILTSLSHYDSFFKKILIETKLKSQDIENF